jgi:transcriptional regulator with XRE-family HTH domain
MSLGAQVKKLREGAGLSIDELCEKSGVRPGFLISIEEDPDYGLIFLSEINALVKALGVEIKLERKQ